MKWQLVFLLLAIGFPALCQKITFSEHIAPIIFEHCTPCHQPGQIAPMPFTGYEEVSAYASMIKYVTEIRYMPPWKAVDSDHHYQDQRGLSDEEIRTIQKWVEGGIEEGDRQKLVPPVLCDATPKMVDPDVVLPMAEAFEQYGVYYDQFKVFVLPTRFDEDKVISAIEFVPGNASIVRSCFISIDKSDKAQPLDDWDPQYGYFSFGEIGFVPYGSRWHTWVPLKGMTQFPKGSGKYLPEKAKLLLHIHYGPTGEPRKDSSYLLLKFAEQPIAKAVHNIPLIHSHILTNPPFKIPAGETIRYHAKFEVPFDFELKSIMPHSQLLGKRWEIFAVEPNTRNTQVLLKIDDWDFKWKHQYEFSKPVVLKAGTVVHALAEYDNTPDNLFNPSDPPHDMEWGKRMFEELFLVYFEINSKVEEKQAGIKVLSNPSMVTSEHTTFRFEATKARSLNFRIKNFSNKVFVEVFENRFFDKGEHVIPLSLKRLPKGNYFLELAQADGTVIARHLFVYTDRTLFD